MWIEAFTNNLSFLISVYRRFKDIKKKGQQRPLQELLVNELRFLKTLNYKKHPQNKNQPANQTTTTTTTKNLQSKKHLSFWSNYASFTLAINTPFIYVRACMGAQLHPTLCDPMDYTPPISAIHGDSPGKKNRAGCHDLLQGSSQTKDPTHICYVF